MWNAETNTLTLNARDEDDDYELPSLAERVDAMIKAQSKLKQPIVVKSDNFDDDEEAEFLKFSDQKCSTPFSHAQKKCHLQKESVKERKLSDSKIFSKIPKPLHEDKENYDWNNESESDEEFSNILENIHKIQTPILIPSNKMKSQEHKESPMKEKLADSAQIFGKSPKPVFKNRHIYERINETDSDEEFSKILENISNIQTPMSENRRIWNKPEGAVKDRKLSDSAQILNISPRSANENKENIFRNNETSSDEEFSNILENISKIQTPMTQSKTKCHKQEETAKEGKSTDTVQILSKNSKPGAENKKIFFEDSESDSDREFSNILENISKMQTPMTQSKKNFFENSDSVSDGEFSNILQNISKIQTSVTKNKKNLFEGNESHSDGEFSNILENISKIQTPKPQNKMKCHLRKDSASEGKLSDSVQLISENSKPLLENKENYGNNETDDSDEEFSNILESASKIQTPMTQNKRLYHDENGSDSDGAFSNIISSLSKIQIPKSQKKNRKRPSIPLSLNLNDSLYEVDENQATAKPSISVSASREKEYAALFPPGSTELSPQSKKMYGQKLYKYFNETIFDSQLPANMNLVWSGSLLSTAGLTFCGRHKGEQSCWIKLSSKILKSFDQLQDTLLHEMCHAAVWMISKSREKHGPMWKCWASRCNLILPFVNCPERCHNYEIPYSIWYQCLNCNWKVGRCKKSRKIESSVCKKCKQAITVTRI